MHDKINKNSIADENVRAFSSEIQTNRFGLVFIFEEL